MDEEKTPEMVVADGLAKAAVYAARSRLHWTSQLVLTLAEGCQAITCVVFLGLALLVCLSPVVAIVWPVFQGK